MSQRHLLHLPSGTPFWVFHSNTQWLDPLPDPSVSAGQSLYEPCLSHSMAAGKQEPSLAEERSLTAAGTFRPRPPWSGYEVHTEWRWRQSLEAVLGTAAQDVIIKAIPCLKIRAGRALAANLLKSGIWAKPLFPGRDSKVLRIQHLFLRFLIRTRTWSSKSHATALFLMQAFP